MTGNHPNGGKRHGLIAFFMLTYAITWSCSAIATKGLLPLQFPPAISAMSAILLHYGPALAAIIVAGVVGGRSGIRAVFGRFRVWRVGMQWYLVVLVLPLLLRLLAVGLGVLLGGTVPTFFSAKGIPQGNPLVLLAPVFVTVLFQAGIAEEIGWRGFALPRLQTRCSALTASLILGALWTLWHFYPLNWPALLPIAFWYLLLGLSFSVMCTWVFNHTQGSLLVAALFHSASDTSDWMVPVVPFIAAGTGDTRAFVLLTLVYALVAVALVIIFGPNHLARRTPAQEQSVLDRSSPKEV